MTDTLLARINKAVAAANEAEKNVAVAQAELVSRSKKVGLLLLEAKKQHPKVADFEAFLKKVRGLKLSRAYDLSRLAGGRTTDEQIRQETRDRVRKHREKKRLPKLSPHQLYDLLAERNVPGIERSHGIQTLLVAWARHRKAEAEKAQELIGIAGAKP
jgi:hypothetical protein